MKMPQTRKGKIVLGSAVAVSVLLILVGALWATGIVSFPRIEALFGNKSEADGQSNVFVNSPASGSAVAPGSTISGNLVGEGTVYVWVKGVNFAVPVEMNGNEWSYEYGGGLEGTRTLVFDENVGGVFGPDPVEVSYAFGGDGAVTYVTDGWPSPLRTIFKPIEQAARAVVAIVSSNVVGGSDGDLDDNGVSDHWQGSPAAPTNGMVARVPYTNLILAVLALALVGGVVWIFTAKHVLAFIERRGVEKAKVEVARLAAVSKHKERQLAVLERATARRTKAQLEIRRQQLQILETVQKGKIGLARGVLKRKKQVQTVAQATVEQPKKWYQRIL